MKKILLVGVSLGVITAGAIAVTAVRSAAVEEKQGGACPALIEEVQDAAIAVQELLETLPGKQPSPGAIAEPVNGIGGKAWSLIRIGCLPDPAVPRLTAPPVDKQLPPLPTLPAPTLTALPPVGLPTVPVCVDLGADLMSTIWALKAALLSTTAPDLTGALDAVTKLLDTVTKLLDSANNCLPASAPVTQR